MIEEAYSLPSPFHADPDEIGRWLDDPDAFTIIDQSREGAVMIRLRSGQETHVSTYRGETRLTLRPE